MFLLSTVICQITLTLTSSFPMAMGQMMVENIPFMHVICRIAIQNQGKGKGKGKGENKDKGKIVR